MSILTDILRGITKPGRDVAELGRLVTSLRKMDPNINKELDTLKKKQEAQRVMEEYQPKYQSQEEQLGTFLRPGETIARDAAVLGSLIAPVGIAGNIASRAGAGAFGAGLGSYGMTPITENADIGKILTSAGLGGILGGTIGAVEKGLMGKAAKVTKTGKVAKYGQELRGEAIGLDPNKLATRRGTGIKSATQGKQSIKGFLDTMDELGIPVDTSTAASVGSDNALKTLSSQFDEILGQADDVVKYTSKDTGRLATKIQSAFKNNPSIIKNAQYQELMGDLLGLGDNYAPSQLNMVREKARELINWSTTSKAGVSERASRKVFEVIDDFFKESVPQAKEVLAKMRDIYTVRPFLQAKAPSAGTMPLGTASTHIEFPTGGLQERIPSAIGKTLQKGIRLPQVSEKVMSNLGNAGIYGTRLGQAIGYEGNQQQPQQPMQSQMPQEDQGISAVNLMLAQGVLNGQISATEANAVLSLLGMDQGGATGKMTESQRDYQLAAEAIEQAYGVLEQAGGAGKLATLGGNIAGFFGSTSASSEYRAALDTATAFLRKALIGSGQSEAELKNLNLPKPTDEPEIAKQKIMTLIPLLRARAGLQQY